MIIKGFAYKLGDNINTDLIISGRYKFSITDPEELARHIFEDMDSMLRARLKKGNSILVAGKNFGMGSSREQASLVIKYAGINAVIAKSFARIFYRNSFNLGLPIIECSTDNIREGDSLEINLDKRILKNHTGGFELSIRALPEFMRELIKTGGIVNYLKKNRMRFKIGP